MNVSKFTVADNPAVVHPSEISPKTVVLINLSGGGAGAQRISVDEATTLEELGVNPTDNAGVSKPVYPKDLITDIQEGEGDYEDYDDDEKAQAIQSAIADWHEACKAYSASAGGLTLEDRIASAVLDRLVNHHGFSLTDAANKKFIRKNELMVTGRQIGDTRLFQVTGTATWGSSR